MRGINVLSSDASRGVTGPLFGCAITKLLGGITMFTFGAPRGAVGPLFSRIKAISGGDWMGIVGFAMEHFLLVVSTFGILANAPPAGRAVDSGVDLGPVRTLRI